MVADVRHAGAGARGGVEPAHVVADLVGPHLRQLRARAEARRPPLAGQHPGGAARDHEVERLDEPAGDRAGALRPGRHGEARRAVPRAGPPLLDRGEAHAAASSGARTSAANAPARSGTAPPTRSSTAPSTSSGVTPSPTAS